MQIYFCESCGKRLTDADVDLGKAVDKKLKGIFCQACGTGVTTQPSLAPATKAVLKKASRKATPPSVRLKPLSDVRHAKPKSLPPSRVSARSETPERGGSGMLLIFAGVAILVLVVVVFFATSSTTSPARPKSSSAEPQAVAVKENPALKSERRKVSKAPHRVAPGDASDDGPVLPMPVKNEEALASEALEEILKQPGVEAQNALAMIAALDRFMAEFPDTMAASRARVLLENLRNPQPEKPPVPEAAAASDPQAVQAPAPKHVKAHDPDEWTKLAQACNARNDPLEALKQLDLALAEWPGHQRLLVMRAEARLNTGDPEGCVEDGRQAIQADGKNWTGYGLRLAGLLALDRRQEAQKDIEIIRRGFADPTRQLQAIETAAKRGRLLYQGRQLEAKDPVSGQDFFQRASFRLARNRFDEARKDLEAALKKDPALASQKIHLSLATVAGKQQDWKARLGYLRAWAEAMPEDPEALNGCAWELLTSQDETLRDPKAALPFAQKAAELSHGEMAHVLDTLAMAYFRNGQVKEAIETQRQALEKLPITATPETRQQYEAHLKEFEAGSNGK